MKKINSTASFLRQAFRILKNESPSVHRRIVAELENTVTNFRVGDERVLLSVVGDNMEISAGWSERAKVEGTISVEALFQLVDGAATVPALLHADCLSIKADSDTLLKLDRIVKLFLESALKSVRLQSHFEEYRRWAQIH